MLYIKLLKNIWIYLGDVTCTLLHVIFFKMFKIISYDNFFSIFIIKFILFYSIWFCTINKINIILKFKSDLFLNFRIPIKCQFDLNPSKVMGMDQVQQPNCLSQLWTQKLTTLKFPLFSFYMQWMPTSLLNRLSMFVHGG